MIRCACDADQARPVLVIGCVLPELYMARAVQDLDRLFEGVEIVSEARVGDEGLTEKGKWSTGCEIVIVRLGEISICWIEVVGVLRDEVTRAGDGGERSSLGNRESDRRCRAG